MWTELNYNKHCQLSLIHLKFIKANLNTTKTEYTIFRRFNLPSLGKKTIDIIDISLILLRQLIFMRYVPGPVYSGKAADLLVSAVWELGPQDQHSSKRNTEMYVDVSFDYSNILEHAE